MTALFVGAALAVAALVYVLMPLFDIVTQSRMALTRASKVPTVPETAIDALREIEFDRATGKLSDDDYSALKTEYTRTALVEMRSRATSSAPASAPTGGPAPNAERAGPAGDAAEAAIFRYRSVRRTCDTCGPRPEPDPVFCSSCGSYLKGTCTHCGARVDATASRFCAHCGGSLAA
jgi:hypothetical protein